MDIDNKNFKNDNNVGVDDLDDFDDLDEPVLPKISDKKDLNQTENEDTSLSNIDFSKIMSSLQSKNPKELRKMISKMGITQAQINQMKKSYENSTDVENSNLPETDLRKRLREKLNKKRLMRQSNQIKKEQMEKMEKMEKIEADKNNNTENVSNIENIQDQKEEVEEIIIDEEPNETHQEVSKKTLQNRKKAQKKKEKNAQKKEKLI